MTDRPPAERADLEAEIERLKRDLGVASEAAMIAIRQGATLTAERDAARTEEREYCARLANWHLNNIERLRPSANDGWQKGYIDACADIETAIRARGAK